MGRSEELYENPLEYNPSRWLDENGTALQNLKKMFILYNSKAGFV